MCYPLISLLFIYFIKHESLQGTDSVSFDGVYYKGETMIGWNPINLNGGITHFT